MSKAAHSWDRLEKQVVPFRGEYSWPPHKTTRPWPDEPRKGIFRLAKVPLNSGKGTIRVVVSSRSTCPLDWIYVTSFGDVAIQFDALGFLQRVARFPIHVIRKTNRKPRIWTHIDIWEPFLSLKFSLLNKESAWLASSSENTVSPSLVSDIWSLLMAINMPTYGLKFKITNKALR